MAVVSIEKQRVGVSPLFWAYLECFRHLVWRGKKPLAQRKGESVRCILALKALETRNSRGNDAGASLSGRVVGVTVEEHWGYILVIPQYYECIYEDWHSVFAEECRLAHWEPTKGRRRECSYGEKKWLTKRVAYKKVKCLAWDALRGLNDVEVRKRERSREVLQNIVWRSFIDFISWTHGTFGKYHVIFRKGV